MQALRSRTRPLITFLPTEILQKIFSYLTDMECQSCIYGTCSLWRLILSKYIISRTARYYRGRAPYIYFPVVHRFFDISEKGSGRCQVKNGVILNYQYRTVAFGYMDVSGLIMDDPIFSAVYGPGWWAPKRQGTANLKNFIRSQSVRVGGEIEIDHTGTVKEEDTKGTPSNYKSVVPLVDNKDVNDAIWVHIKIGHKYHQDAKEPQSSAWERIALPKKSTIKAWTNAILDAIKLHLDKGSVYDFDIDFRETVIHTHDHSTVERWHLEVWVVLPENL